MSGNTRRLAVGGRRAAYRALFLLAALFQASLLNASVIYVSTNTGSDANSGLLSSAPKATIGSAYSAAANDDTIKIASGVYNESLESIGKSLSFEGAYSADFLSRDYAVLRSTVAGRFNVNNGGLILSFDGLAVSSGTASPFYLYWGAAAASTVTISNSVIFNSSAPAITTYGTQYYGLTVASNTIYNCRAGVNAGPGTYRAALIYNNVISDISEFGGNIGDGGTGVGIKVQGTGPVTISSNTVSRALIYCIDSGYPNGTTLIEGNTLTDCGSGGLGGYWNGAIRSAAGAVEIRNNLIIRARATAIKLDYSNYGSVIRNNTIVGGNTNFAVEDGNGAVFRNNIIFNAWDGFSGTDYDVTEIAHNVFGDIQIEHVESGLYNFKEAGLSFFTPTMHDNIVIPAASTAAVFVNAAAGDYRLAANSIAIDAGDPDDDRSAEPAPNGGRIDAGAYGGTALAPASETAPPGAVADLAASAGANVGEIALAWSAPGDDGAANRNVYGAYYELRYATYSVSGYTQAQWWAAADTYAPQTAWIVAEDTSVTKNLDVANLTDQPMGVPGFAERRTLAGLEAGVTYYFMLKTTDNSGNVSDPDANSAGAVTMASAPAQGAGNHAPVLGHTADNALGPVSHTTDGTNVVSVKFRVKDPDGAADTSTIAVRAGQYYTSGPQFRVDGGSWDDIELQDVSFSASPFVPAADFSGTEYTLTWATTMTVTSAESAAAEFRFKVSDGSSESLWASTGPFMLDNKKPVNPSGAPTYRWPVSLQFNWGQSTDINFTDYRVVYATYSFSQCYAAEANREWTSAGDPALAVRQTTFTVVTGLTPGVTYWYYVEARDSYGHRSSGSNCIGFSTVTLGDYGAPGAITDLAASPTPGNSGGITLEWTVPGGDGASGNMTDAQYAIKYSTLGIITAASFDSPPQPHHTLSIATNTVAGQKNRVFFTGLTPGASYWFAIKVKDSAELWNVWNSSQDVPSDNVQAFARAKDYGTDPPLGVFSGDFSQAGGAVYDGTGPDEAWALAVDTITAGGPFVYAVGVSSTGGGFAWQDFMIVKYDSAGGKVLSRYYHNYFGDTAYAAAVDRSGNLYVTGQTASGSGDWLTLKFDPNLDLLASAKYNGPDGRSDTPRALAIDPSGNIIVAGNSYDAANHPNYVTLKYAQDLSVVLATAVYDGGGNEEARAAAVDAAGNIVVTGGNGADFFTIKYDNSLAVLSSAAFNGSGSSGDTAYGVGTDAAGNIFVTGSEWGASGFSNYLTLKYSSDLAVVLASASFNGPDNNNDYAYALAVDTAGYVLVTGASLNSSGNDDIVTLKYGPALGLIHSDSYDSGIADVGRAVAAGPGGYTYVAGTTGSYPGQDQRVLRRVLADVAPPAGVTDLAAQTGTGVTGEIRLSWTAPGDDGAAWSISGGRYEIKYTSVAIITAANYGAPPAPTQTLTIDTNTVPGQSISHIISGLLPGTSYWFALRTRDEAGNWSVWTSSHDSPGDNTGAYAMAKRPGNDPPLGVFSGDFSQAGGAAYNGTGTDQAYGVAVDTFSPGGPYVYVVGLSSITGGFTPYDWLVVKYDAAGNKLISQRLGGPNGWNDYARAAAVDPWGNLVVAGYIMTPSQDNMLTVKFDQNLDIISSATYNGPANSWDQAYGVAVDAAGNIFVAGQSRTANYDFFTIKYSSALVALASATYNAGGDEQANAVAVNSAGEVIVAGTRNSDFFTIKYSADLTVLSSAAVANTDAASAVAVDPAGNIIVAGEEWGGAALENFRVVKYDPTLTSVLVSTAINGPGNGNDYAYGVAVDSSSNILVAGKSQSGANYNIYTVKLDPNLSLLISSASYNGGGDDIGRAVAAGASGYVYTAGYSANGSNDDFRALRQQFPDLPPPPTLAGAAAGVSSITWTWNDVNLGETGYLLIASTGGPVSGALAANAATWPETGLSTNTAYSRRVVALNMPGVSTSAAFTAWTAAAPPADAAATVLSSATLSVSWVPNGNPAGTDFEVSYSTDDNFTAGLVSTAPLTQAYSLTLGSLLPYTTYFTRVRAYNGNSVPTGFSVAPSTRTNVPPPQVPALSAAALGVSSLSWTWTDVSYEEGYSLYSDTASIFTHGLAAGATAHIDTGLPGNFCAARSIRAFNVSGSSQGALLEACTLAAAPVNPATMVFSSVSIAAVWDDGGNAGAVLYEVSYSSADAFITGSAISTASAGTAFGLTLTGLQALTTYYLRVQPVNLQGVPGAFTLIPSTRTNAPPPAAPALSGAALGVSSIAWSWAEVQHAESYRVFAATGGPVSPALSSSTLAWTETGLSANSVYARYAGAFNISGSSSSAAVSRRTPAAQPAGAAAAVVSSTTLAVSWEANGNPAGTDFEVSWSSADAFLTGYAVSTAPLTQTYSASLGGLQPYTTYYVRVRAYDGDGAPSPFDAAASTRTNPPPPVAPTLAAVPGDYSIAWSWGDQTYEDGYSLYAASAGAVSHVFGAGVTAWTDDGVGSNVCFARRVSAFNVSGSSASAQLTACSLAVPPASPGTAVLSPSVITLGWGNNGNSPQTVYEVSYSSVDAFIAGAAISTLSAGTDAFLTLSALQPYTEYFIRVRAYNQAGVPSDFSVFPSTRTDAPAPPAPALAGAALGFSSIAWSWADVLYETGYRLVASTGGAVSGALIPGAVAWTEQGLSTNTAYARVLEAFNGTGASQSPLAAVWTPAAPPAAFSFSEVHRSSVALSWDANTNPPWTDFSVSLWAASGSTVTVTVTGTSASFTGLTAGTSYYAVIHALNGAGQPSAQVSASSFTASEPPGTGQVTPGAGGTVTYNAAAGPVSLDVPPGAFAAPVDITVQAPSSLPAGSAAAAGLTPVGVGAEVTPASAVQPALEAELTISYRDADVAGLDESKLVIARYEPALDAWLRLPSVPDPANNRVTARTGHFSLFQLMAYVPAQTSAGARAYPNPCRPSAGCSAVTVSRMQPGAKARVYTLSGELVRTLTADNLGFAVWDTRNSSGSPVAGGVYFISVKGGGKVLKIAIVK